MLLHRVLGTAFLAALFAVATQANDDAGDLQGLWVSTTPFERPAGELTVRRGDGAWIATLGARETRFDAKENDIRFRFADAQVAFRGRMVKRRIEGFWIQDGPADQPMASPLALSRNAAGEWRGEVPKLNLGFTLYLKIFRREDGTLIGAFRNPEVNTRGGASRFYVQREGTTVRFLERDDGKEGIAHTAALSQSPDRLKLMWPQFRRELELVRKSPEEAAAFFPKPPGITYVYAAPPERSDGWQTARARNAGLDEAALTALVQKIAASDPAERQPSLIHSLLIARRGKLLLEEYFFGHDADTLHDTRSAGKTFASVMLGAAMHAGTELAPDTPIAKLLSARGPLRQPSAVEKAHHARPSDDPHIGSRLRRQR
ncbi:MAG: hypothetical protein ACKVRO_11580 [Micropepsaceae bacterium]